MKEAHDFTASNLIDEFRKQMNLVGEFGANEVNSIKNENIHLNKDVEKLFNEKKILESEIQRALFNVARLETVVGIKQPVCNFSNSNL